MDIKDSTIQTLSNLLVVKNLEISSLRTLIQTLNERIAWLESQIYPDPEMVPEKTEQLKREPVGFKKEE